MSNYQRGRGAYGGGGRFRADGRYDSQDEGASSSSNWRRPYAQHSDTRGSSSSSNWRRPTTQHPETGDPSASSSWRRPTTQHPETGGSSSSLNPRRPTAEQPETGDPSASLNWRRHRAQHPETGGPSTSSNWRRPTTQHPEIGGTSSVYVGQRDQRGAYMGPISQQRYPPRELPPQTVRALPRVEPEATTGDPIQDPHNAAGLEVQMSELAIQPATPSSSSGNTVKVNFPRKPGSGTRGDRLLVKANHFLVELPERALQVEHYNVVITRAGTDRAVTSLETNRAVMRALVRVYKEQSLGSRLPVFDGRSNLYTAGRLPFEHQSFRIALLHENRPQGPREFDVKIDHVGYVSMKHLEMFLAGRRPNAPQDAIQALDIVLRECLSIRDDIVQVQSSFFSDGFLRVNLGGGLEMWGGFYQTLRPTQMGLSLNLDTTATAFYESRMVLGYVSLLIGKDLDTEVLSPADIAKIKRYLRGVKVVVTHQGNIRRKYRIAGLTKQATRNLTFSCGKGGIRKRVVDHFRETYNVIIRYLDLPCLEVGNNPTRPTYLPMEVCRIAPGQRYTKRLSDEQRNRMIQKACECPADREKRILDVTRNQRIYERDNGVNFAQEFGLLVSEHITTIQARVLPSPVLKYHNAGAEKECMPTSGVWNMRNKKMVHGGKVNFWYCISFSTNIGADIAVWFCNKLGDMCRASGMEFERNPILPHTVEQGNRLEAVLKSRYQEAISVLSRKNKTPDLLIVVLPDHKNGNLYSDIKRICETEIGLVTQCCLARHVKRANPQTLANLALKINVKVGGKNTVLADAITREIPVVTRLPTIIFGADVTHPDPGEDTSPSIAAVVASQDWPEIATYVGLYRVQGHRQEIIFHLGEMVKELLMSFRGKTNFEPQQIIFYRDGVSDGQFQQVLRYEINAIRTACKQLSPNYKPAITFIVVQKKHHTRLFPAEGPTDPSGNVPPGTVVDTEICHPTEFDFYLCSHAGIKGTSSPTHYHVLWDDNRFNVDDLQTLTYNLCYTYARCTRSVSIVPPAYYAHHFATRAQLYCDSRLPDSGSFVAGPSASRDEASSSTVRQLPPLKDNVKNVMFYC